MDHKWDTTLFEAGVILDGITTCAQTWTCRNCGEVIRIPSGFAPHSDSDCEMKKQEEVAVEKFRAKIPKAWGNGKKARGG